MLMAAVFLCCSLLRRERDKLDGGGGKWQMADKSRRTNTPLLRSGKISSNRIKWWWQKHEKKKKEGQKTDERHRLILYRHVEIYRNLGTSLIRIQGHPLSTRSVEWRKLGSSICLHGSNKPYGNLPFDITPVPMWLRLGALIFTTPCFIISTSLADMIAEVQTRIGNAPPMKKTICLSLSPTIKNLRRIMDSL